MSVIFFLWMVVFGWMLLHPRAGHPHPWVPITEGVLYVAIGVGGLWFKAWKRWHNGLRRAASVAVAFVRFAGVEAVRWSVVAVMLVTFIPLIVLGWLAKVFAMAIERWTDAAHRTTRRLHRWANRAGGAE